MNQNLAAFQKKLLDLPYCTNLYPIPHIRLEHGRLQRLACDPGESLPSRFQAKDEAEGKLKLLYVQAAQQLRTYSDPASSESCYSRIRHEVNEQLTFLRESLIPCRTDGSAALVNRIAASAALVNRIAAVLASEDVFRRVEPLNEELQKKFSLSPVQDYIKMIRYEVYDPSEYEAGAAKLIAKLFIRHGYDLTDACFQLEQDAETLLTGYRKAIAEQASLYLHQYVVASIQGKLPTLNAILENERSAQL